MEDGIWRTVGGRRIFIKEGEDLSSAMKRSGKFKNDKKNPKPVKQEWKNGKDTTGKYESPEEKERIKAAKLATNSPKGIKETNDSLKNSGIKVTKSFETDLFGNGKEERYFINDNQWITHTTNALGKDVDDWYVTTYKNGSLNDEKFSSYEEMIKKLKK